MQPQVTHKFGAYEIQAIVSFIIVMAIMGAALFGAAGSTDWPLGWAFLGAFLALSIGAMVYIWRVNPEIFAARRKFQKGTKSWDAVVASLAILCFFLILPVAGFDFRFGWSVPADWMIALGYILLILGYIGTTWAQAVNRHFEPTVRIQTDRQHAVISTGLYAHIRHPGYAFGILMAAGIPLSLGSLVALIPVAAVVPLLFGRTLGEEAELHAGLPGYTAYADRVRWRWLPGVW